MRYPAFVPLVLAAIMATSCQETGPVQSSPPESNRPATFVPGTLVVFVQWDGQGLPGKRVEVVELKRVLTTNKDGVATFVVPAGTFILRAYDINRGGPPLRYIDTDVFIISGEETRVEIVDCLPCV